MGNKTVSRFIREDSRKTISRMLQNMRSGYYRIKNERGHAISELAK